jgi:hypothetical protein
MFELNERFLGPGPLAPGLELPTEEVVRPAFWVFGTNRVAIQRFEDHAGTNVTELAERLDLFGQLNLSDTNRIVVGIRPLDKERNSQREYTSIDFTNGVAVSGANLDIQTLFFEGDFGQIFPGFDPFDGRMLDWTFSVGRQPVFVQDGTLINANWLDAVSVSRNNLTFPGVANLRTTAMFAWHGIHRNDDLYDPTASLVGWFTEADLEWATASADLVYVDAGHTTGSAWFAAVSAARRYLVFGRDVNSTLHVLTSVPTGDPTPATGRGTLLFHEASRNTDCGDIVYCNLFAAIDRFSSAARSVQFGGPLMQTGILFASPVLGQYGSALNSQSANVLGGAIGRQWFLDKTRKQVILELGGRVPTDGSDTAAIALGARYQQAIGNRCLWILEGFVSKQSARDVGQGIRCELETKF